MFELYWWIIPALCVLNLMFWSAFIFVIVSMNSSQISRDEEQDERMDRIETKIKLHKWSEHKGRD